ncbi:MAG: hypothetical protein HDR08_01135 [Lachnospiraceae bacterium]|nr:hypothetical protein [Lachnospiraceae bacterium]
MEKAAAVGAKAGIDKFKEEAKRRQEQDWDKRYHNTRLLLGNYRMLKINAENSVFGRRKMEESASDIPDSMMNMFEVCCERSGNDVDERRYDIIHRLYG